MKPIRQWLARCEGEASHSNCLPLTIHWPASAGVQFRVIDIHRRCIAVAPENCRYIALSYVWGAVDQPKLTMDVSNELAKEGGLAAIWPKIPQTVRDAIAFCDGLGERYLWVDALCIMQDSPRDMRLSILRMRQIYAAAKCTLGAISANTASAGLSASFRADACTCLTADALYRVIDLSPWSRRAWCYQEKVLSHRMIFFTSRGLYMQCQSGVYSGAGAPLPRENKYPELNRYNTVGGMLSANIGDTNGLQSYLSAVEHYSSRTTTKRTDKMNAFQGILQMYEGVMDGTASTFYVGLPAFAFDLAICWRAEQHNPEFRNPAFPSWSWLGWGQAVRFHPAMALEKAHTNQMFASLNVSKQFDIMKQNGPGFREIAKLRNPANHINDFNGFGFPASTGQIRCPPSLSLDASIAKLSIASEPKGSNNHNNCYAFYPLPSSGTSPPLGYIWLHEQWRAQQEALCIIDFMPLLGNPDAERPGKWTIKMLMCLDPVNGNEQRGYLKYERLQVMDCELCEEAWLNMGGVTAEFLDLV
ncbi:uncharacterized protein TrAtP1_010013 [Trichoderma atroviride]|nr:hypothetical protein TrAtP1_010013 [Trichoderma atroviride]